MSKVISEFLWFCITSLSDWFKVLAPLFQPIRIETKTSRGSRVHIFPPFVSATGNYFEFWLVWRTASVLLNDQSNCFGFGFTTLDWNSLYLTIILRNRAEYRPILSRRGRRPSWLKSGDIPQDWAAWLFCYSSHWWKSTNFYIYWKKAGKTTIFPATHKITYIAGTNIKRAMTIFGHCHNVLNNKYRYRKTRKRERNNLEEENSHAVITKIRLSFPVDVKATLNLSSSFND